jgi:hypothetical protein
LINCEHYHFRCFCDLLNCVRLECNLVSRVSFIIRGIKSDIGRRGSGNIDRFAGGAKLSLNLHIKFQSYRLAISNFASDFISPLRLPRSRHSSAPPSLTELTTSFLAVPSRQWLPLHSEFCRSDECSWYNDDHGHRRSGGLPLP